MERDARRPRSDGVAAFPDPRLPALGAAADRPPARSCKARSPGAEPGDYRGHLLGLGVPDSGDLPPDTVFALDAGFEELAGVDFRKGCYVGQEVTSRMKHRASARRRFLIAEVDGDLPPPGTKLEASGREVGTLATGADGRALALVRLDRVEEARQCRRRHHRDGTKSESAAAVMVAGVKIISLR